MKHFLYAKIIMEVLQEIVLIAITLGPLLCP